MVASDLLERAKNLNRRTLDPIAARLYFFFSYFHDASGTFSQVQAYQAFLVYPNPFDRFIISAYRTATLRQDNDTQATLLNIILKNYIALNLIDQADKLVAKAVFPESVGNNQLARYMYYLGRIKAIQLDYSESYRHLLQAIRKAPQTPSTAGFQEVVSRVSDNHSPIGAQTCHYSSALDGRNP